MATQRIPNVTLPHVAGDDVALSDYRGKTIVLLFAGRHSGEQAEKILDSIRGKYTPDLLPVLQIANLKGTPRLMQGLAKKDIKGAYQRISTKEAARIQAAGRIVPDDLSQTVPLLLDWEGAVAGSLGLTDIDKTAVAVIVDGEGQVHGSATGAQGGDQLLTMLA